MIEKKPLGNETFYKTEKGVAKCCERHTKMNALNTELIDSLQQAIQRERYSHFPVVAAPYGMTWARLMGICLFRFGLTMFGICLFLIPATLAMQYSGLADKARINMHLWWGGLIFSTLWMVESWTYWHHKRGAGLSSLLAGNRESEFWTAFQKASRKQWFLTWAMGLPPLFIMLSGLYILALAFNIRVPLLEYIVVAPLMFAIADIPVSFGGFGTMTMAWFLFFGDYGASENIAALTLFLPAVRAVIRAAIGIISLPFAMKDIPTLLNGSVQVTKAQPQPEPGEA